MNYSRGEIVWVKFPFSDNTTSKLRPALILSNNTVNSSGDYIMMQITSKLRNDNFSFLIKSEDYSSSPLLKTSELRLHKIFILNESLIAGGISIVTELFMKKVLAGLIPLIQ